MSKRDEKWKAECEAILANERKKHDKSVAMQFFLAALNKTKCIGDVRFDDIHPNLSCSLGGYRRVECDVVLTSDEAVAVVEVKHNVREDDVDLLHRWTEPHLREFLGLYRFMHNQPLLVAVAGMLVEDKAIARAHEYGYAVLTPDGQNIRVDSEFLRHIPHAA